jgi:hypothetical protein
LPGDEVNAESQVNGRARDNWFCCCIGRKLSIVDVQVTINSCTIDS